MRSQLAAQSDIRPAQLEAAVQPAGVPLAIRSSINSSEPWTWPITGVPGSARAAASLSGVR